MRGHSPPGRSEPWGEPGDCLGREVADSGKTPEESRHFCVSPPKPACILQPHIPLSLFSLSRIKREHPGDGLSQEKGLLSEKWVLQGGGRKEECEKRGQHGGRSEGDKPTAFPFQPIC